MRDAFGGGQDHDAFARGKVLLAELAHAQPAHVHLGVRRLEARPLVGCPDRDPARDRRLVEACDEKIVPQAGGEVRRKAPRRHDEENAQGVFDDAAHEGVALARAGRRREDPYGAQVVQHCVLQLR